MSSRLVLLLALAAAPAGAADPDAGPRVHVLMVLDTSDPDLIPGVRKDRAHFEQFLRDQLPKSAYRVAVIDGDRITPERVLNHYRDARHGPADVLVFYYSGHGSIRPGGEHTLELQKGSAPLPRKTLRQAMTACGAAATILLTDCCSDRFPARPGEAPPTPRDLRAEPTPLGKKLFYETRGLVDLTASTNDVAYSDDERGGYFTAALCRVAARQSARPLGWREFYQLVRGETVAVHEDAITKGIAPKLRSGQKHQEPAAMVDLPSGESARGSAVVGLANLGNSPVELDYRWGDEANWKSLTLAPNERRPLELRLAPGATELPALTVKMGSRTQKLLARHYAKEAPPHYADGRGYRFAAKPTSRAFEPEE